MICPWGNRLRSGESDCMAITEMIKKSTPIIGLAAVLCAIIIGLIIRIPGTGILRKKPQDLTLVYPTDRTVFPPDLSAPTFVWKDGESGADIWTVSIQAHRSGKHLVFVCETTSWKPDSADWELIKSMILEKPAEVVVDGKNRQEPGAVLSSGKVTISTSRDEVGAPIFYRDVNLPFIETIKDPSRIKWRLGHVSSSQPPPVVLENLPVCGNCHSFSADGSNLAMDVDYANDKGSYIITRISEEMHLATSDIITWEDFERNEPKDMPLFHRDIGTFGLLSQISPDGEYVISTVKDQSVFVDKPDLAFSQLFFPVKGILAVYSRRSGTFSALPGADDPDYVQSNPSWSPDGKTIVFARSKAYDFKPSSAKGKVLLTQEECREFLKEKKPFRFDLYRIPFNQGRGGHAVPLEGASFNGMSNFFAKYSPDGRWIVFCQAKKYMLLQPDSKLFIIPAEGGEAEALDCNTALMNSWHSWSPNSRWLVFSSKKNTPYTQLFLTHIDKTGGSSPPVLLEHFTSENRAANIPEFLPANTVIRKIHEQFVDDYSFVRKGELSALYGDINDAIEFFRHALKLNPDNYRAHLGLGLLFHDKGLAEQAMFHYKQTYELEPRNAVINNEIGVLCYQQKQYQEAAFYLSEALSHRGRTSVDSGNFNAALTQCFLGCVQLELGDVKSAHEKFKACVTAEPDHARYQYMLTLSCALMGRDLEMLEHYTIAVNLDPAIDRSPVVLVSMARYFAERTDFGRALHYAEKGLKLAVDSGNKTLVHSIRKDIQYFRQKQETRQGKVSGNQN